MSEIERLVREQDERWLGHDPREPRWRRDAEEMESEVPRRRWDADRRWTLYELMMKRGGTRR
jgi:hypothetical protein